MQFSSVRASTLGLVGAVCALGMFPSGVMAYPVTWEFKGTVTLSQDMPQDIPVGSPFRVVVGFDTSDGYNTRNSTNDPVTGDPRPGVRYQYFGAPSLQFAIYAGDCNPCIQTSVPDFNTILVRDDFADPFRNPAPDVAYDGYSFGMDPSAENDFFGFLVIMRDFADAFDPPIVDVESGDSPLPVEPDPRMVDMRESVFQAWRNNDDGNAADDPFLEADIDFVGVPTYGTYYFLSGRHCAYPDLFEASGFFGDDCIVGGGPQALMFDNGGSAGMGGFSKSMTPTLATPDAYDPPDSTDPLGTVFGEVTFGGPGSLPVLRANSLPTEVARTNSNVLAYQEYVFGGTDPTPLQLIVDLGYEIYSNWESGSETRPNGSAIDIGLRPGGASVGTTLAIVDASLVPASAMNALQNFNTLVCGNEGEHQLPDGSPWPTGSILGMATYLSDDNDGGLEQGAKSVQLQVLACDGVGVSTVPVLMQPGEGFYLAASIQTPARGSWAQDGQPTPAANGFLDAANTVRVVPDPEAPPEVLQALVAGLEPACADCSFEADDLEVLIDVKPGFAVNSIKVKSNAVIDVAILGSTEFNPSHVDTSSLLLGSLALYKASQGKSSCSLTDVNIDGIADLLCGFRNEAGNWQPGQTSVELTGLLTNGQTIVASDSVRLVP